MKTGLLYGIVASSKTRVRCVFCGVHIPKANKCIEQHTNGSKHQENIELRATSGISFKDNYLHCKSCKCVLGEDESVAKHVEGDDHANWMVAVEDLVEGEFIDLDAYLASGKDNEDIKCEVCSCTMTCTLLGLEEHVNSFNHRANLAEKLKTFNGIFPVESDSEVWCKVCDANVENTVENILDHIDDDERHLDWFAEMEELIDGQDVTLEDYLSNELQETAFCQKCNVEIACNLQSIEDHVNSETHLNQFG